MRCASLVVFRQQPPRQILQRKRAKESKTARVCQSRDSETLCVTQHSLLLYYVDHYSMLSLKVTSQGLDWRTGQSGWVCAHTKTQRWTKGAAQHLILLSRQRVPFHFLFCHHGFLWNASPSPPIPCILLLSEQRASWGQQGILWKCIVLREHTHVSPHTPPTQLQRPVTQQSSAKIISISYSTYSGIWDIAVEMRQFSLEECSS